MLRIEKLHKSYVEPDGNPLPVLDIRHFELGAGEQTVIRGHSGCGKTTLLHAIAGIIRVDAGRILFEGTNISRLSEARRDRFRAQKIGYVFQTFNLLSGFSALENVLLGMTFTGLPVERQRAVSLLDRVGLTARMTHKPAALSVGEQQRVAVARALANRPDLLLADEPTANVDPANQKKVIELLRSTCEEEKVALILVTHAADVANLFDRVEYLESLNKVAVCEQ